MKVQNLFFHYSNGIALMESKLAHQHLVSRFM